MEKCFAIFPHYGKNVSTLWKTFCVLACAASTAAATDIRWIGDMQTDPAPGALEPGAELVISTRIKPQGAAVSAEVGLSTNDGVSWKTMPMSPAATMNDCDVWSAPVGGFTEGTALRFYICARNADGQRVWDSNTGADYRMRVNSPIREVSLRKSRYNPGEMASIAVDLQPSGPAVEGELRVRVMKLAHTVQSFVKPLSLKKTERKRIVFPWITPTNDFCGYGVDVDWIVDGQVRDSRSTAIDVSSDWIHFPRFGFFSEYPAGENTEKMADALTTFHINAVQFYDWKWTHDRLVPYGAENQPLNIFTQVGGRVQSFQTVTNKIASLHAHHIAALSYNLMYGDSGNDEAPEQVEWAAFKVPFSTSLDDIRTHNAGPYKIWVMDASNPEWKKHIFDQFNDAIDRAGFDGIHLDNLGGEWTYKFNSDIGIPEREVFPQFIQEARAHLRSLHPNARLTHNDVMGNYLPDIARSDVDVYYSEVWTRHTYQDLRENILEAQAAGNRKAVILAAYINRKSWGEMSDPTQPELPTFINDASAKLLDACIFANGGFHIELGDDAQMLVNEYFPARTPRMHPGLKQSMRDYYDFAVRYENYLFFDPHQTIRDITDDLPITSHTHALSRRGHRDTIWTVAKIRKDGLLAVHLINLNGIDDLWRNVSANPSLQTNIELNIRTDRRIQSVLHATPDDGLGRAQELPFVSSENGKEHFVTLTVPRLAFWTFILLLPSNDSPLQNPN